MKIVLRRFCSIVIVLLALVDAIQSDRNEKNDTEVRKGRVNGRIVKLYSGAKPDPILCLEEGFKADPVDCTVFYRCTQASRGKYSVFRFQCGPGTVYDPETEVCNHPRNTKRSECGGLIPPTMLENENEIEDQELPSPINSTSPVYTTHIESNNLTAFTTTSTTQKTEQYTEYKPITTVSYPSVATTEQEYIESSNNIQNYPWSGSKNKTEDVVMHFTTTAPNSEKSFPCTSDGFIGDSENCRKFYRCVSNSRGGFVRYEFLCSESTVWDDNIQSCNHAWAVRNKRCGRSDFSNKNSTIYDGQSVDVLLANQEIQNNYGTKIDEQQNYNSIKEISSNNLQYGNKLKIDKYTKNTQTPYTITTSAYQDTLVSKMEDIYDKYEESDIKGQNDDFNEINHYRVTTSSYYSNNYNKQNYTTQTITVGKNIQCIQSGFMADPVDCKKFYRCVDNGRGSFTKYEFSCSQETVWDSKLEACNYAWAVKECGGTMPAENPNIAATTNNPITPSTIKEYNDNGYVNQPNQEHEQTTSSTILTTISLLLTSETPKGTSAECATAGFFGDPNECQKFYRCINNEKGSYTKYDYICGDGTLWDQTIQACNHAWAVNSCNHSKIDNQSNEATHTTQATSTYESSPITTVSYVETTVNKNTNNADYDSGYNHQQSITTLNPSLDNLKTTLKNPQMQKNNCESSGFMGDTSDCKKFYRCVDNGSGGFTRHEFSCGEGTVWDPEIEACNHAWAVKQCGGIHNVKEEVTSHVPDDDLNMEQSTQIYNTLSTSQISSIHTTDFQTTTKQTSNMNDYSQCETNGFMGDKFDCKKFYRCVDSGDGKYIRYEFSCGEGTVWDPKIQACNHAWAVEECGNNEVHVETTHNINDVPVRPSTSHSYEDASSYTTQSTTKLDNEISTTILGISTTVTNNKQECQLSGFMGDQNDCKKFYRCVDNGNGGFTKHEFSCGEGTAWDSKIEACNHEYEVQNCGIHSESQSEVTPSSIPAQNDMQITTSSNNIITQLHTEAVYSSTTSLPDVDQVPSEENECTTEGFFGNTNDCKRFFRCVNDGKGSFTRYDFSCGDGTVWVQELQACDHDTNETNCSYTASTEKYEISNSTDSSVILNTTDPIDSNIHNDEKCAFEGFYPHLNDCRRFYRCVKNGDGHYTKYEFTCADGTAWDVNIGSCNNINNVNSCRSTENININTPVMQDEQVSESESNMSTTNPTTLTSTTENTKPTSKNECNQDGYFGNIEDCKKFYRCVSNEKGGYVKYDYDCGEGTIWDQDITACNHPQDVTNPSCSSDQESSSTTTINSSSQYTTEDNTKSPQTTSSPSASSTASSTNKNETNSTCSNSESSNENPNEKNITCTKAGFYPNPNDCKKFYRCVDWDSNGEKFSVFHFECGDGTIWDPSLDTCNHIDSVYPPRTCNGTSQQSENAAEPSSTTDAISTTTNQGEISTTVSDSTAQQTTDQQTTPQQTTTQQTSTQQTTTQQTTKQDTTSQQTTIQQTTTEQTTTQQTTKEDTTTQQTSTEQTTTQQTTTEQTTTEKQSATEQQSTTERSTESTQSSTTEKSTTQQPTTTESDQTTAQTTQEQTTKSSTSSAESTVSESSTTDSTELSSTTEQVVTSTQPMTSEENTSPTESQSSTTEASTTENEHQSSTESNTSNQDCPETDDDQYLLVCPTSFKRHPKYCNLFYQCTEDNDSHETKVATFNCPNNTIYDESKVQCVEEDKSNEKCNGQIAKKYRVKRLGIANIEPIVVTKDSMACPSVGHFPFEKHEECSAALLKCEKTKSGKLRGYIYKCPEGFIYWSISRRCESLKKLKDCKKPLEEWNKRYDIPIEKYNIAH